MELENVVKKFSESENSYECFIDGTLIETKDFIKEAVQSSSNAYESWKNNENRAAILKKVNEAIATKMNMLVQVAKSIMDKTGYRLENDIMYAAQTFTYFSKWANKIKANRNLEPKGCLCAAILKDCPIYSALSWLVAAPLAAGNTVVLLVCPVYSKIALYFAVVLSEAGVSPGVFNVIPQVDENSFPIISSYFPRVIGVMPQNIPSSEKFHFSNVIFKKSSLCPMVVLKSADIDSAVECILSSTQTYEALWFPNVIYVEEPIYEKFVKCLRFASETYANCHDKQKTNQEHIENNSIISAYFHERNSRGVEKIELIHRFSKCLILINSDEALQTPVLVDEKNVTQCRLISLLPVRTSAEAISFVNASSGGLAISLWSNDALESISLPFQFQYGTVWVNSASWYSPSVPLAPWASFGYGTFTGKRALYEHLTVLPKSFDAVVDTFYPAERNLIFSKKEISSVVKQLQSASSSWLKLDNEVRAAFVENAASLMEKNWNTHFKIVLDRTTEMTWKKCIQYLNFWSSFTVDNAYQQTVFANNCRILCKSEPLGVVGVIAGSTPLDMLLFLIAAAIMYGNVVVVGISSDEKCSITGTELENLFSAKPGVVNVIVNNSTALWEQFISDSSMSAVWLVNHYCKCYLKNCSYKNIVGVDAQVDMTQMAEFFELYATKQKSVWLPILS